MRISVCIIWLLFFAALPGKGQETYLEYKIEPLGGRLQFEQVLETQLNLPDILLTRHFSANIKTNFSIDSAGRANDLQFEGTSNNVLKNELSRIMAFYRFRKTNLPLVRAQPYVVVFALSTRHYKRYIKQKSRARIQKPASVDSSFAVYTRVEKLPQYYKGGDAGLNNYILAEFDYPPIAREQSVEGTVVLDFVVETNGFVTGIEVKQGVGAGCTQEAIRIIRKTRWQPAEINGQAVRCRMAYPITFSLRKLSNSEFNPTSVGN